VRYDIRHRTFVVIAIIFTSAAACSILFIKFSNKDKFIQVSQSHKYAKGTY